jgi:methyl-accepting chemotaxis protein
VRIGTAVVNEAGCSFADIATLVVEVSNQVQKVASTMHLLSDNSQQIIASEQSINKISKELAIQNSNVYAATEEQLAAMQEVKSASESLTSMAVELQGVINEFKL